MTIEDQIKGAIGYIDAAMSRVQSALTQFNQAIICLKGTLEEIKKDKRSSKMTIEDDEIEFEDNQQNEH